jgi:hypothetical protein
VAEWYKWSVLAKFSEAPQHSQIARTSFESKHAGNNVQQISTSRNHKSALAATTAGTTNGGNKKDLSAKHCQWEEIRNGNESLCQIGSIWYLVVNCTLQSREHVLMCHMNSHPMVLMPRLWLENMDRANEQQQKDRNARPIHNIHSKSSLTI